MKKIIIAFISIAIMLTGCSVQNNVQPQTEEKHNDNLVKSVWITYYELGEMIKGKSEDEFRSTFSQVIDTLKALGFNTITVQVRAFGDAFYESKYFPTSSYIVENQGDSIAYDPLSIICELAKDIDVEAWVNPYRISNSSDYSILADSNIAKKWKDTDNIIEYDDKLYFNPASNDVTELIKNGAVELVKGYNIKAIHFDDYFYPTTDKSIDKQVYKDSKTEQSLSDWRRNNVTNMIKAVGDAIHKSNPNVRFGISPNANIKEDKNALYADIEAWLNDGLIDYVCPQIYYGFKNETMPFMFVTKKWLELSTVDTYIGLPLYKTGKKDEYAGTGKDEFLNSNVIERQINYLSKIDDVKGIYIFSYSSINGNEDMLKKFKEI